LLLLIDQIADRSSRYCWRPPDDSGPKYALFSSWHSPIFQHGGDVGLDAGRNFSYERSRLDLLVRIPYKRPNAAQSISPKIKIILMPCIATSQ